MHLEMETDASLLLTTQVNQPFDEGKFNFKKALQQEVLFQFDASAPGGLTYSASAPVSRSPNLVFINISPIEYGHVLLVPRVLDGLNQVSLPALLHLHPAALIFQRGHMARFQPRAAYRSEYRCHELVQQVHC